MRTIVSVIVFPFAAIVGAVVILTYTTALLAAVRSTEPWKSNGRT